MGNSVALNNPERFTGKYIITKDKINKAVEKAVDKLYVLADKYRDGFANSFSQNYKYTMGKNDNWVCGMQTGMYWIAYELTGDKFFKEIAEGHLNGYVTRVAEKTTLLDHDVGFIYSPSCVAQYKITGNEVARKAALDAAEHLYNFSYSEKGGFILRYAAKKEEAWACRTMMDTLLNIPLLLWAYEETGIEKYKEAANSQCEITENYLIRNDFSTFHHYQFDTDTHKPLYGLTFQGHTDASCWSRGHAWGIYGFPVAYSYFHSKKFLDVQKNLSYFMLNHLPEDNIPYWDYDFTNGSKEPRDSSAAVVSLCGLKEACKYLSERDEQKVLFENAAEMILESVIDSCTEAPNDDTDGLLFHVTGALPQNKGIDECAIYGDYFYLESLIREVKPDWNRYW